MNPTKLCQLATADGKYAVEFASGENGLMVRAKRPGKVGPWTVDIELAVLGVDERVDNAVLAELCERVASNRDFDFSEAIPFWRLSDV